MHSLHSYTMNKEEAVEKLLMRAGEHFSIQLSYLKEGCEVNLGNA